MKKSHPWKVIQGTTSSAFSTGLALYIHPAPTPALKLPPWGHVTDRALHSVAPGLLQVYLPLAGTHIHILPNPPPLHCHTDNILDQQAGVCESSQFPSSLHIYIFPSKFAVPSTTKSFCGPTWLALASEMWTEMAVDKFWAYTKGQHIFCSLLLLRILPRHSSGSRRMKHTWNRATLASQQTWKNGNACLLLAIGVWAALLHGMAR